MRVEGLGCGVRAVGLAVFSRNNYWGSGGILLETQERFHL